MRIIHALEGQAWSGGQQQALFLAEQQHRLGHDVVLMCQKNSVLAEKATAVGLDVRANDYGKELHPRSIMNLLRVYRDFKPDVVNFFLNGFDFLRIRCQLEPENVKL